MITRISLLLPAAFLLSVLCLSGRGTAGSPTPVVPMRADFEDGTGLQVQSDGQSGDTVWDYIDGVGGVQCDINPPTGDFRLYFTKTSKPKRRLNCDLTRSTPCVECPVAFNGLSTEPVKGIALNVGIGPGDLLTMADGAASVGAFLMTENNGILRLQPGFVFDGGYRNCSGQVQVVRDTAGTDAINDDTWEISPLPIGGCSDFQNTGRAVLVQSSGRSQVPAGYCELPFRLTIRPK